MGEEPKPERWEMCQDLDCNLFCCCFLIQGVYFVPLLSQVCQGRIIFYVSALEKTAETWLYIAGVKADFLSFRCVAAKF